MINLAKRNFNYPKPTSLDRDKLVAAYNMIPSNNILKDISGNNNNGNITGSLSTKNGMRFNGIDNYITCPDNNLPIGSSPRTFNIIFKSSPNITDLYRYGNESNGERMSFTIRDGYILSTVFGHAFGFPFINDNKIHTLTIIFPEGETLSDKFIFYFDGVKQTPQTLVGTVRPVNTVLTGNSYIGAYPPGSDYSEVEIYTLEYYNRELKENEIEEFHNNYAKQVYFKDDFEYDNASPLGWTSSSGNFIVKNVNNQKMLTCEASGNIRFNCEQAYGTWEFDFIYNSGNFLFVIFFLADKITAVDSISNGYRLAIYSDGTQYLDKVINNIPTTLYTTDTNTFESGEHYSFKVTRDYNNEFSFYYKKKEENNYILIPVLTGSNPLVDSDITSSKYYEWQSLKIGDGDSIGNLIFKKGIEV
jgi:hypothetical protein